MDPAIDTPAVKPKKKRTAKPKKKKARRVAVIERPERLDMRLTKAEKARIMAKCKKTKRTITSVVLEAIAKVK